MKLGKPMNPGLLEPVPLAQSPEDIEPETWELALVLAEIALGRRKVGLEKHNSRPMGHRGTYEDE